MDDSELFPGLFFGYCDVCGCPGRVCPHVCREAAAEEEVMSRIDAYLRAIETDTLDEYYYKKDHPHRKPYKYTKGKTNERVPGKYYGDYSHGKV